MTNAVVPAPSRPMPKPGRPHRSDLAFLPAALEILETPPSPVRMSLIALIGTLAAVGLTWSYCSRIDIFAVANGKIRPTEQVKTVEASETGRVRRTLVTDGAHVNAGDVVVELDSTEAQAEASGALAALASDRAEVLRRRAAVSTAEDRNEADPPAIDWPSEIPQAVREREMAVLRHDLGTLQATVRNLKMQAIEKTAERDRLRAMTASEAALVATLQERVNMRSTLLKTGSSTKASLIDALQTLQGEQTSLAADTGRIAEAEAALNTLAANEEKARESFIGDNAQRLADAERQAEDHAQRAVKARAALEHTSLTSPIKGTVQSLSITSVKQVVTTGQQVMRIVPDDAPLEIEAYVGNRDIGFVRAGQEAVIKIDSIPFTRYGTILGRVVRVARDSIPVSEAQRAQSDPTRLAASRTLGTTSADATETLVYPVAISLSETSLPADGQRIALSPGMTVNVEIQTGSRRILEYLFSPLAEAGSEAMRER